MGRRPLHLALYVLFVAAMTTSLIVRGWPFASVADLLEVCTLALAVALVFFRAAEITLYILLVLSLVHLTWACALQLHDPGFMPVDVVSGGYGLVLILAALAHASVGAVRVMRQPAPRPPRSPSV